MVKLNANYKNIKESYLFSEVAHRESTYRAEHPDQKVIKLSIGDVTLPLVSEISEEMAAACMEESVKQTFKGYGPEQGYAFLRDAIVKYYSSFGITVHGDEVFVGDGAKSDVANIVDLFDDSNTVVLQNPVYPVYLDSNLMRGRKIVYVSGNADNGFLPMPDGVEGDLFYLCSPANPTGAVYNREQLQCWVDYARSRGAIILFDAAYEAFVSEEELPRSIFAIEGARECAIEFCSFSKLAGFTGIRCGYTVVPKELIVDGSSLNKMWLRRQTTKFNGASYPVQRGAAMVFRPEVYAKIRANIDYYMVNAKMLAALLTEKGIPFTGGINSPYIWLKCTEGMTSWEFFDYLLNNAQVVGTPGSGFGSEGEGYFRLTAFNTHEATAEAVERLRALL